MCVYRGWKPLLRGKDEILNILVSSKNYRGIMALLHFAYGDRFLHTFKTVVQDDKERFLPLVEMTG